eukprot:TRINITY_DN62593_c0_g1_i1.p1 TRINITY_DN62593_c0_g1~~TRINITY_DN62593_c0_g1_i1.p1  ORF type:complete len:1303 (+),score=239.83 TRINITY_DN62593_c0_g1_i1:45-3911(+)
MAAADAPTLAKQIAEATQVLNDPSVTADARRAANEFVLRVAEHPLVVPAAAELTSYVAPPAVRFFAFRLLVSAASSGRILSQDPSSAQLRTALLDMATKSTLAVGGDLSTVPSFVKEKYTQALAAVAVYGSDWPGGQSLTSWSELQPHLLEAGRRSSSHAALALTFFRNLSEILQSDAATRLPPARRKALQAHLMSTSTDILGALALFVGSLFPGRPEVDRSAVLLAQELSSIVPVAKFLSADVDRFLHQKLMSDTSLRPEILQAFSDWLSRDIAKDLKDAPARMRQFVGSVCDLAASCTADGNLSPEDYEVHKAMAMLIRDFVECNKPVLERNQDLQELAYRAALKLMRYPSVVIQMEALSVVPLILKSSLGEARKVAGANGAAAAGTNGTDTRLLLPWLALKAELLPLLFLCTHKEIPINFELLPLPQGYRQALEISADLDVEEDLPNVRQLLKIRGLEVIQAISPSPAALIESLEFVHELLPRAVGSAATASSFASFDAALGLAERILPCVKASAGPVAVKACGELLLLVLQATVPGPEHELRRLDFLSRAAGAFDHFAEAAQDPENALVVRVFTHLFSIIESGGKDLRIRALYSAIGVSKAAPKAIRPVLEPIVQKAAGLLSSAADSQHVLCEALVAASTAAQNFEQQQQLVQNLLSPLVTRWEAVVGTLAADPNKLVASFVGDRVDLETVLQLVQCFWACFRSSTVPSDPTLVAAGGFLKGSVTAPATSSDGLTTRNPAAAVVAKVLPGAVAFLRSFHVAFTSDVTRRGEAGIADALRPYLCALDKEEIKALTSSLDSKQKADAAAWEDSFPPPAGEEPSRVFRGRTLLYSLRLYLYKCLGAALNVVQDGALNNPELPAWLVGSLIESMDLAHPYHLELQLRHVWHIIFGVGGMPAASEALRHALASALLPKLLPAATRTLHRYWEWLQLPESHPAVTAATAAVGSGKQAAALLWAMCTGTVMASRTLVELECALTMHGDKQWAGPNGSASITTEQSSGGDSASMTGGGGKRKNRKGKNQGGPTGMDISGKEDVSKGLAGAGVGGKQGGAASGAGVIGQGGFAQAVFASPEAVEAVQRAFCSATRWPDEKTISNSIHGMRSLAVRLMSNGEAHESVREIHVSGPDAPQRCVPVVKLVLQPILELCKSPPPPPPGDGALHTVIGKPFADFFSHERQQGRVDPSPFASAVIGALWPVMWGLCEVFTHICKRAQTVPAIQHVAQFPTLAEACQQLTTLNRVSQQDVQGFLSTMLAQDSDPKEKRAALRLLVRAAVDPELLPGETLK